MNGTITSALVASTLIIASGLAVHAALERSRESAQLAVAARSDIPASIREEHDAIHQALIAATKAPDPVGTAARNLAAVLHPHFEREEQVALPPLGALRPLASGQAVANESAVVAMSDSLRRELPQMLAEHVAIRQAVAALRSAAVSASAAKVVELSDHLALHALTEEEVLYPAAILAGSMLQRTVRR